MGLSALKSIMLAVLCGFPVSCMLAKACCHLFAVAADQTDWSWRHVIICEPGAWCLYEALCLLLVSLFTARALQNILIL